MRFFSRHLILIVILILAASIRLVNLSTNPPGLTWDEAALGYNAYSLLLTGRDEYGVFLPLTLKSFGDFKPALSSYLDIPFVATLGLSEWAVRLPSALAGILSVWLIYLLVKELFGEQRLALLSAFFMSINPWSIQFSRAGFEANVTLLFNLLAVYLFIKGLKIRKWLIHCALIFGLSLLTYQGSKIFVPLLVFSLLIIYRKQISWSQFKFPTLILVGFLLILFLPTFIGGQNKRLETLNVFAYRRSPEQIKNMAVEDELAVGGLTFQVLHGEWFIYLRGLIERYLIYFSPKMLFIEGDYSPRHSVPDLGVLYYFDILLIPLGFIFFFKRKKQTSLIILAWLLLAPIPAVLSRDLISTLRALNMVIPIAILEATGLYWLLEKIAKNKVWLPLFLVLSTILIAFNVMIYIDRYFLHAPRENSKYWLYGYKQMYQYLMGLNKNLGNYNKIVISDSLGQPYIYYLFYNKYHPSDFQRQAVLDQPTVDVGTVRKIDKFEFRHIYWPVDRGIANSLFVGPLEELPDQDVLNKPEFNVLKEINFLDGKMAFRVVETK